MTTPVDGRDRRDIRQVLRLMQDGDHAEATKQLQKIVCGWVVPDNG